MIQDERDLVRKLRSGDRRGFEEVYHVYSGRVLGFTLRLCGERAEAEDLVQEVFLAAYAGRKSFQGRASLLTWLLGIASRRWRDRGRKQRLEMGPSLDEEQAAATPGTVGGRQLEEQVIDALAFSSAVDSLEAPFREALLLVASQGLTYREAADVLGEPVGTVKWRVSEATRRMRRIYCEVEEEFHELQRAEPGSDRGDGSGRAIGTPHLAVEEAPVRLLRLPGGVGADPPGLEPNADTGG
jgi:RNA polymerase sigma-70 factor (ECF subfamily)